MVKTIIAGRLEVLENIKGIAQTNKNLQRHAIFLKIVGRLQKKRMLAARRDQNFDALGEAEKLIKKMYEDAMATGNDRANADEEGSL